MIYFTHSNQIVENSENTQTNCIFKRGVLSQDLI